MLVTGVGLWAEDALARPQWVSGTWSVSDGLIRRVGDELADRADRCGFIVPGMVDAHCHIGYSSSGPVSPEEMIRQSALTLASGVTLVRDCGVPVDNSCVNDLVGPRLIRCGRHVARPKRYMRDLPLDVEDQRELPRVLADMAGRCDGWVKIVGDWIDRSGGADADLMPLWDPSVLREAVAAVHEAGARIAVHAFSHRVIDSLIEAGVDDIEHGSGIDADQASEIAARGIAVTPTLRQVELFATSPRRRGLSTPSTRRPCSACMTRVSNTSRCFWTQTSSSCREPMLVDTRSMVPLRASLACGRAGELRPRPSSTYPPGSASDTWAAPASSKERTLIC